MAARGGRPVLWWPWGELERRSLVASPDDGLDWASLEPSLEAGPRESRVGDFCWWVRTDESLECRAKDCSKGLGSRSKLLRRGRWGGRWSFCVDSAAECAGEGWDVTGDWINGGCATAEDMTWGRL